MKLASTIVVIGFATLAVGCIEGDNTNLWYAASEAPIAATSSGGIDDPMLDGERVESVTVTRTTVIAAPVPQQPQGAWMWTAAGWVWSTSVASTIGTAWRDSRGGIVKVGYGVTADVTRGVGPPVFAPLEPGPVSRATETTLASPVVANIAASTAASDGSTPTHAAPVDAPEEAVPAPSAGEIVRADGIHDVAVHVVPMRRSRVAAGAVATPVTTIPSTDVRDVDELLAVVTRMALRAEPRPAAVAPTLSSVPTIAPIAPMRAPVIATVRAF